MLKWADENTREELSFGLYLFLTEAEWELYVHAFCDVRDRDYELAKCTEPHDDGTKCYPTWDGFTYVCIYRLIKERKS